MSNCPQSINNKAGVDLYQDLEYILKDVTNSVDIKAILDSNEEKEEIIKLCLTTISQIYDDFEEKHIRTFINNILNKMKTDSPEINKVKLKLKANNVSKQIVPFVCLDQDKQIVPFVESEIIEKNDSIVQESKMITAPNITESTIEEKVPSPLKQRNIPLKSKSKQPKKAPRMINERTMGNMKITPEEEKERAINRKKIEFFKSLPLYKQKSKEWLEQRLNYLTASTIAAALGLKGPVARSELLLNKVSMGKMHGFQGNLATHWGNKYEPVANSIYSNRNGGIFIQEFGMITNEKYKILGISPDGVMEDRLLEIKCPYSRVIKGDIKTEYYHQMQEQMAVTEYKRCHFLECKLIETPENNFWDDFHLSNRGHYEKGIIISYVVCSEAHDNDFSVQYLYSPIEYHKDITKMREWKDKTISELLNDPTRLMIQETYWCLDVYSCQLVDCDPQWIIDNYPILEAFWAEVEYYRKEGVDKLIKKLENDRSMTKGWSDDEESGPHQDFRKINTYFKNDSNHSNHSNHSNESPPVEKQVKKKGKCLL